MEALGGRKFVFALIAMVVGVILAYFGHLDSSATALLLGLVSSFHISNTILSHKALDVDSDADADASEATQATQASLADVAMAAPQPSSDLADLHAKIDAQADLLRQISQGVTLTHGILEMSARNLQGQQGQQNR